MLSSDMVIGILYIWYEKGLQPSLSSKQSLVTVEPTNIGLKYICLDVQACPKCNFLCCMKPQTLMEPILARDICKGGITHYQGTKFC